MKNKNRFFLMTLLFLLAFFSLLPLFSGRVFAVDPSQNVKDVINKAVTESSSKVDVVNNDYTMDGNNQSGDQSASSDNVESKGIIKLLSPQSREVVVNNSVKVSGKADPGVIVNVTISDEDSNNKLIRHQSNLQLNGSVTADKNGDWVYIPQLLFVPGEYSVAASFSGNDMGTVQSDKILFMIVDGNGSNHWYVIGNTWIIAGAGLLFLVILIMIVSIRKKRDRKNGLQKNKESKSWFYKLFIKQEEAYDIAELNAEVLDVEKELTDVAREVNSSMKKVGQLRRENIERKSKGNENGHADVYENKLKDSIDGVEEEIINVSQELNEVSEKVEHMREGIVEKMKK